MGRTGVGTLVVCLVVACAAPETPPGADARAEPRRDVAAGPPELMEPPPPLEPTPWTDAFEEPAVLLAEVVTIEGPIGLLEHSAITQGADTDYAVQTIPEGLLQEALVKGDDPVGAGIRAQLDGLQVMALKQIRILQRPGDVDITVVAKGDAYWKQAATGAEQRGDRLSFVGRVER